MARIMRPSGSQRGRLLDAREHSCADAREHRGAEHGRVGGADRERQPERVRLDLQQRRVVASGRRRRAGP